MPAETRKQVVERRLRALEIHIQNLEERLQEVFAWHYASMAGKEMRGDDHRQ